MFPENFPDPFVLRVGDTFYAYATNDGGTNVPVLSSTDVVHWTALTDALPELAPWAVEDGVHTWAPSVLAVGNGYRMFITVLDAIRGVECIGVASSGSPSGPFALNPYGPLVCGLDGAIDASPFTAADGSLWLTWKYEGFRTNVPRIVSQRLTPDAFGLTGPETTLLRPSLAWEHANVEGPSMVYRGHDYLLFYAASGYDRADYATGLARCDSPTGPCYKQPGPFLSTSGAEIGPGGLEVFTGDDQVRYGAYHSWIEGVGYPQAKRALNIRALNVSAL